MPQLAAEPLFSQNAGEPLKEEGHIYMAKPAIADEVQVLRFFETGPIQKVEAVFNIVSEKVRERLQGQDHDGEGSARRGGSARKRHFRPNPEAPAAEPSGQTT